MGLLCVVVVIAVVYLTDFGFLHQRITSYPIECVESSEDGKLICDLSRPTNYYTIKKDQIVIDSTKYNFNGVSHGNTIYRNCVVVDRKNWECKDDSELGLEGGSYFGFTKGNYYYKHGSNGTMLIDKNRTTYKLRYIYLGISSYCYLNSHKIIFEFIPKLFFILVIPIYFIIFVLRKRYDENSNEISRFHKYVLIGYFLIFLYYVSILEDIGYQSKWPSALPIFTVVTSLIVVLIVFLVSAVVRKFLQFIYKEKGSTLLNSLQKNILILYFSIILYRVYILELVGRGVIDYRDNTWGFPLQYILILGIPLSIIVTLMLSGKSKIIRMISLFIIIIFALLVSYYFLIYYPANREVWDRPWM